MKHGLLASELAGLNKPQTEQVQKQWKALQHGREIVHLPLSPFGDSLEGFAVHPQVWHPTKTSARYHASYLFFNNARLFRDKRGLDMGAGTGIMGIVMARYGASHSVLSDISHAAVINATENVKRFNLEGKTTVLQGDLYENIPEHTFDFIVFNQPFFSGTPEPGDAISASMLNSGELIDRFLENSKRYLSSAHKTIIMMPSYAKAGDRNNPVIQGPRHVEDMHTRILGTSGADATRGSAVRARSGDWIEGVGHVLGEDTCAAPRENKSTCMRRAFLQQMAEEDVQQIVFYIAEDNLHAADAFRAAIEKALKVQTFVCW
jgi:methylase of polypeptide subunit release factors